MDLFGMCGIALLGNGKTRSICAENPKGEVGKAAMEIPDENNPASMLGQGWKVRPCITVQPFEKVVLADIEGPGTIKHIWITATSKTYRDFILRMYWDDEDTPSVEVPLGDFFCNGHAMRTNVSSIPIAANPSGGFNSYWPMPFRKNARIEIESQHKEEIRGFFYQVDYELGEVPDNAAYFHAQWRRSVTPIEAPLHVILDNVKGRGHYVGTYFAWTQLSDGWWGEGEIKFYMDGDTEFPTICGTGTEDYVGGAWCFGETYSGPFLGYPLWKKEEGCVPKHGLYRWHIPDPIRFTKDLKVTIQALGYQDGKIIPRQDDIASTAYWYQTEPHGPFPEMPPAHRRWVR